MFGSTMLSSCWNGAGVIRNAPPVRPAPDPVMADGSCASEVCRVITYGPPAPPVTATVPAGKTVDIRSNAVCTVAPVALNAIGAVVWPLYVRVKLPADGLPRLTL